VFYVVDLFAGCGGMSEGFQQAGFNVIAEVEMNHFACETLRTRHLFHELIKIKEQKLYNQYVRQKISLDEIYQKYPEIKEEISKRVIEEKLEENGIDDIIEKIKSSLKYNNGSKVNVLIGGPPCQPYSLIGRSRDPDRMQKDERHYLYRHYLTIMRRLRPDFFVYENVPGLFSAKAEGGRIFEKLQNDFSSLDPAYVITPPLKKVKKKPSSYILNSSDFNVPERRKRLILIGYKKSLEVGHPLIKDVFKKIQRIAIKNRESCCLDVHDAIGDLPSLQSGEGDDRYFGGYLEKNDLCDYQKDMRKLSIGVLNHKARTHMASDLERYRFFIEHHNNGHKAATLIDLIRERPDLTPGHENLDDFIDRFKVQWWDAPSSTITAHISKDGHYFIHPDIEQCRSFTVREAARCQSFPDNYFFEGPRTEQFKQVGNAVPPRLAYYIARQIRKELNKLYEKQ